MKALISQENGVVYQLVNDADTFEVAPPFVWVDCNSPVIPHRYKLENGAFVEVQPTAEEIKQKALAELAAIDLASIRALREYIASKPDAPQILKDRDTAAAAARAKL